MTSLKSSIINKISKNQSQETKEVNSKEEAVDFLVFVVHGVGEAKRHYKKVRQFEEYAKEYIKAEYGEKYTVHFIAIRWHDELHDLNTVDKRFNAITLNSCQAIRSMTSNFMGDVLFYFTSYHGQRIISAVVELMNNAYNEYKSQHPDFKGKVILFGHSLGGVILYDILVNQDFKKLEKYKEYNKTEEKIKDTNTSCSINDTCFSETEELFSENELIHINNNDQDQTNATNFHCADTDNLDNMNYSEERVERKLYFGNGEVIFPSINFYPEFFYVCGSSISAAMIMRCQYYQNYHLPEHIVFQNIYNRTDPFAYRYEPMVDEDLQYVKPVCIKNININNSNVDYENSNQINSRSAGSNTSSLFTNLRERFSNKLNHSLSTSPTKIKSNSEQKGLVLEKTSVSPDSTEIDQKDTNNFYTENIVFSPKSTHSYDDTYPNDLLSASSPSFSVSSLNSPSKLNKHNENDKVTESSSISSDNEISKDSEEINKFQPHRCSSPKNENIEQVKKCTPSPVIKTENSFISYQGPKDILNSTLSSPKITDTTITIAPTSSKVDALENASQVHETEPVSKSPKKNSDGLLNKMSRFFSQNNNDNDHNNDDSSNGSSNSGSNNNDSTLRSPQSSSINSLSFDVSNNNISQENNNIPGFNQNSNHSISANDTSETNNTKQKKMTIKCFPSFKSNSSSSESRKKSLGNSESKSSNGNEIESTQLPDGRIAINNHPLLKYRVDYVLQENISDVIKGSYVAALGAHTSYWQNRFLIYHIMKSIITKTEYDEKEKKQTNISSP
ncbi:hypothetical protein BCR36DRAFT_317935, partial [Piromyces finnis]